MTSAPTLTRNPGPLVRTRELERKLLLAALVAVAVLIKISRLVTRMIMMLAGHFLLCAFVTMPVLIDIPGLVTRMLMMGTRLFLGHC